MIHSAELPKIPKFIGVNVVLCSRIIPTALCCSYFNVRQEVSLGWRCLEQHQEPLIASPSKVCLHFLAKSPPPVFLCICAHVQYCRTWTHYTKELRLSIELMHIVSIRLRARAKSAHKVVEQLCGLFSVSRHPDAPPTQKLKGSTGQSAFRVVSRRSPTSSKALTVLRLVLKIPRQLPADEDLGAVEEGLQRARAESLARSFNGRGLFLKVSLAFSA